MLLFPLLLAARAEAARRQLIVATSEPAPYVLEPYLRVSLCVPAMNEAKYIGVLLQSARNQTYPFHDIAVADSSYGDDTAVVAQSWGARVVRAAPGNISSARNLACGATTGEVVVFSDADVLLHPQFVELCLGKLQQPNVALVHPKEVIYDSVPWNMALFFPAVMRSRWNTTRCVMVWRTVCSEVGGYDPGCNPISGRCREDLDFGRRVGAVYGAGSIKVAPFLIGTSGRRYKQQGLRGWEKFAEPARSRVRY